MGVVISLNNKNPTKIKMSTCRNYECKNDHKIGCVKKVMVKFVFVSINIKKSYHNDKKYDLKVVYR